MVYNLFLKSAFNVDTVNHHEHSCNLLWIFQMVSVFEVRNKSFFFFPHEGMKWWNKTEHLKMLSFVVLKYQVVELKRKVDALREKSMHMKYFFDDTRLVLDSREVTGEGDQLQGWKRWVKQR